MRYYLNNNTFFDISIKIVREIKRNYIIIVLTTIIHSRVISRGTHSDGLLLRGSGILIDGITMGSRHFSGMINRRYPRDVRRFMVNRVIFAFRTVRRRGDVFRDGNEQYCWTDHGENARDVLPRVIRTVKTSPAAACSWSVRIGEPIL